MLVKVGRRHGIARLRDQLTGAVFGAEMVEDVEELRERERHGMLAHVSADALTTSTLTCSHSCLAC